MSIRNFILIKQHGAPPALQAFFYTNSMCLTANVAWSDADRSGWTNAASNVDAVYDEPGFSTHSTGTCMRGGNYYADGIYDNKFADLTTQNSPEDHRNLIVLLR